MGGNVENQTTFGGKHHPINQFSLGGMWGIKTTFRRGTPPLLINWLVDMGSFLVVCGSGLRSPGASPRARSSRLLRVHGKKGSDQEQAAQRTSRTRATRFGGLPKGPPKRKPYGNTWRNEGPMETPLFGYGGPGGHRGQGAMLRPMAWLPTLNPSPSSTESLD